MSPFSESRSLRMGNINITLSHTHSAFAHYGPYILRGHAVEVLSVDE